MRRSRDLMLAMNTSSLGSVVMQAHCTASSWVMGTGPGMPVVGHFCYPRVVARLGDTLATDDGIPVSWGRLPAEEGDPDQRGCG